MSLARLSAKFVGLPYQLGAMDCFSAILGYIEDRGYHVPQEFEGQTRSSYAALFTAHPQEAKAVMIRLIDTLLPTLSPTMACAGDVLLLRLGTSLPFLAIDGGNGNAIAATEHRGVTILPRKKYTIERAWRCQQQSL